MCANGEKPICDCNGIEIKGECPSLEGFDWELYADELYRARSHMWSGPAGIAEAEKNIHALLTHITKKFSFAFECPLATVSTYYSLATIMAFKGNMRR